MKICLLTRYPDFRGRGVGRVYKEIRNGLVKRGHSVYTISTTGTSLYSYFWYTLLGIPFKLPRKDIDVYHAIATMEGMWLPRDKSIVTFHDLFTTTNPERVGAGMGYASWKTFVGIQYFKLGSKLASRCRFLVCVSNKTKEDVIKYIGAPESKIRVIRSGISNNLRPQPKRSKVFRVGYLGQLDRRKRIYLLIQSFKESPIGGELVIAGVGPDEAALKELAGEDARIKFLGLVPEDSLVNFYNSLDVFVLPTWIEGYGLPIVEAMACKKPVVVLTDAIIPQEVKSRCIIVEDLDLPFGNLSYLEGLITHVDYEGNYEWAKGHSWDTAVDEYIKLYKEIIG